MEGCLALALKKADHREWRVWSLDGITWYSVLLMEGTSMLWVEGHISSYFLLVKMSIPTRFTCRTTKKSEDFKYIKWQQKFQVKRSLQEGKGHIWTALFDDKNVHYWHIRFFKSTIFYILTSSFKLRLLTQRSVTKKKKTEVQKTALKANFTLACPCLPVLEVDISTILQGCPFSST